MYSKKYKSKSGREMYKPVFEDGESPFSADQDGWCLACGQECYGVEPDARRYKCESCGEPFVYGLEELAIMGLVEVSEID